MFETELKAAFKEIFKVDKITFDEPGESREQECIFVEIENARPTIRDGQEIYKVTGNAIMIAQSDKMPFGFFGKALKQADPDTTKDFFFYALESNTRRFRNIVQRGFSFVYFFNGQYDPDIANIESVDLTVEIEE